MDEVAQDRARADLVYDMDKREVVTALGDMTAQEIAAAPGVVARQADTLAEPLARLIARLNQRPPQLVVTCARGSSAHAATFGKHQRAKFSLADARGILQHDLEYRLQLTRRRAYDAQHFGGRRLLL